MPVDYDRIKFLVGKCDTNINSRGAPTAVLRENGAYLKEANAMLSKATRADKGTTDYTASVDRIKQINVNTLEYAREAAKQRLGEADQKIAAVGNYVKRERGQTADVHFKASKNPLKWASLGRPPVAEVESAIDDARTAIQEAQGYVKDLTAQMKKAGFDLKGYEGFNRIGTQLAEAGTRLKTAESQHTSAKSKRISEDW